MGHTGTQYPTLEVDATGVTKSEDRVVFRRKEEYAENLRQRKIVCTFAGWREELAVGHWNRRFKSRNG